MKLMQHIFFKTSPTKFVKPCVYDFTRVKSPSKLSRSAGNSTICVHSKSIFKSSWWAILHVWNHLQICQTQQSVFIWKVFKSRHSQVCGWFYTCEIPYKTCKTTCGWFHTCKIVPKSYFYTCPNRLQTCQTENFIFIFGAGIHKFVGDFTRVKSPTKLVKKANFNSTICVYFEKNVKRAFTCLWAISHV